MNADSRPWWGSILGFRSGKKWKAFIAILAYLAVALMVTGAFTSSIISGIAFLLAVALVTSLFSPLRGKLPGFRSGHRIRSTGSWLGYGLLTLVLLLVAVPKTSTTSSSPPQATTVSSNSYTATSTLAVSASPTPQVLPTSVPSPTPTLAATSTPTPRPTATPIPTPTSTPTPTPIPRVGSIFRGGSIDVKVVDAVRQPGLQWTPYGNYSRAQGELIIVYLEVTNNTSQPKALCSCNMFMEPEFVLMDTGGRTFLDYNDEFEITQWRSYNRMRNPDSAILPGSTIKTGLVFDVPVGAKDLLVKLKPLKAEVLLFPSQNQAAPPPKAEPPASNAAPTTAPPKAQTLLEEKRAAILEAVDRANQIITEAEATGDTSELATVLVGDSLATNKRDVEIHNVEKTSRRCNLDTYSVLSVRLVDASAAMVETRESYTCTARDEAKGKDIWTKQYPESTHVYTLVLRNGQWFLSQEKQ